MTEKPVRYAYQKQQFSQSAPQGASQRPATSGDDALAAAIETINERTNK